MDRKVEGVYPTTEEAIRAVKRLRNEGYALNSLRLISNDETAKTIDTKEWDNVVDTDDEASVWETVKSAFTSYDASKHGDIADAENAPLSNYKKELNQGKIAVVIEENTEVDVDAPRMDTQTNTVGPEGTRDHEEEQRVKSKGDHVRKDPELTTDELEGYDRQQ